MGLGGYILFSVPLFFGVNPLWALPVSALVGAALSLPVAWLVFRLREPYFAIGSWVVAEVFRLSAAQMSSLRGGSGMSLPIEAMKSIGSKSEREMIRYQTALAVCLGAVVLSYLLLREHLADLGAIYLMLLGAMAIAIMFWAPKGIWGLLVSRWSLSLFPVGYRIRGGKG